MFKKKKKKKKDTAKKKKKKKKKKGCHFFSGVKKLRVRVIPSPPSIQTNRCHWISSMILIRVDDMYNVSPLSCIGTPNISSLGP